MAGLNELKCSNVFLLKAETLKDLVDIYCLRCSTGLYNCTIAAKDCPAINGDRDFENVMEAERKKYEDRIDRR